MIEIIENIAQFSVIILCAAVSAVLTIRNRRDSSVLLFFFYVSYALADLFSILYLLFYNQTPVVFYVSDLGWYSSYLFLYMLLVRLSSPGEKAVRCPALWALPAFSVAMAIFFMQWGDYPGNIICAVLMSLLLYHSARGLVFERRCPQSPSKRPLYILTLSFCTMEYSAWIVSCFWSGDSFANLYFWFDCMITVSMLLFLPAYRKAVPA